MTVSSDSFCQFGRTLRAFFLGALVLILALHIFAQKAAESGTDMLDQTAAGFELKDESLFDGLAKIHTVHEPAICVEFILKKDSSAPPTADPRLNSQVRPGTVRDTLDQLVSLDGRYTWSRYKNTVNVFPRAALTLGDTYFPNRTLHVFQFASVSDPHELVFKTASLLPGPLEQIAYINLGAFGKYSHPWSATFSNISVRDIFDEIAMHFCDSCGWTLSGTQGFRVIQFHSQLLPNASVRD